MAGTRKKRHNFFFPATLGL